jgi:hypothetical protein
VKCRRFSEMREVPDFVEATPRIELGYTVLQTVA